MVACFCYVNVFGDDFLITKEQLEEGLRVGFNDEFIESDQGRSLSVLVNTYVSKEDVRYVVSDAVESFIKSQEDSDDFKVEPGLCRAAITTAGKQAIEALCKDH